MISFKDVRVHLAWGLTAPSIILVLNSFVWTIFSLPLVSAIINGRSESGAPDIERTILLLTLYSAVGISAIIGSKFFPRARTRLLEIWHFVGTTSTGLLIFISGNNMIIDSLLIFFFGTSVGIGMPSCLSQFANSTKIERRGITSGFVWSLVGFCVLFLAFLTASFEPWQTILALVVWRFFGGIGFASTNKKNCEPPNQQAPSYLELIRQKEILLYLLPWALFCLLNFAEAPILKKYFGLDFAFTQVLVWSIAGFVAALGGYIADIIGRKSIVIAGFGMLGVEYAIVGLLTPSQPALYLYSILDGISWGLLSSVFLITIWGDLGENCEKEKYYVLGGLTFFISGLFSDLLSPHVDSISTGLAFSFASFFLFLAVIPLVYARETLPKKEIRKREIKDYLKTAEKIKEKYQ